MRPDNTTVRKSVIAVTAVAAIAGAGFAAPQLVAAAGDGRPTGRSVVDRADEQVREAQGHHRAQQAGDDGTARHSGLDSPRDRAERTTPNGRHLEPGDDRSRDVNETDDSGVDSPRDRAERKDANGRHIEPGDDRGREAEPGDDRGGVAEPGDDTGNHVEPGDDNGGSGGGSDDSSGSGGGSDDSSGHGGGGSDDSSGHGGGDD